MKRREVRVKTTSTWRHPERSRSSGEERDLPLIVSRINPKLSDYENWLSDEIHPPYFPPARFLPSIITQRKIRLIRVW
jgi:hypothetical protein